MRKGIVSWLTLTIALYPEYAAAAKITIDGTITLGSSMGVISNNTEGYTYGRTTKNLGILSKACPTSMGSEIRCVVTFEAQDGSITKIISARRPSQSDPANAPVAQQPINSAVSRKPEWKDAFSRRNYQLGMRISEFRTASYPDQKEWPGAYSICSDEKARISRLPFNVSSELSPISIQNTGVIKCIFVYSSSIGVSTAGLMLGSVSPISNNFLFVQPKDVSEPILFQIEAEFPTAYYPSVLDSLRSYYGTSDKISTVDLTTGIGIQMKGQICVFENTPSKIVVRQYSEDIRRGAITYTLTEVANELIAANRRSNQRPGPP